MGLSRVTLYTMEAEHTEHELAHVKLFGLALSPFESLSHRSCFSYKVCRVSRPYGNSNGKIGHNWGRRFSGNVSAK